jgi:hypothetical protein
MNPTGWRLLWLLAVAASCLFAPANRVTAEESASAESRETNAVKNVPGQPETSPVETFRKLLAMSPEEQARFLAHYPPEKRRQILEKVQEYRMLPGEACELRLQVTELRWYLIPLLKAPPGKRAELLKSVPEPYRQLIVPRLDEWDIWPPDLKEEVLEYESTLQFLVGPNAEEGKQPVFEELPEADRLGLELKLAEWRALPLEERKQMFGAFRHYFELSEAEQQKVLSTLSAPQRQETEKVLNPIEKWPKPQQDAYLVAFRQFAEMSPAERQNFMLNVRRWQRMSPAERQAWRDLVHQVPGAPPWTGQVIPLTQPAGPVVPAAGKTNPATAPLK